MARELHLELLLGKCVYDSAGDRVGRIEEVRAEPEGDEWQIVEYWIGIAAIVERFSAWQLGVGLLSVFGARKLRKGYRVPWDQLDLSNPDRPRLVCTIEELKQISQQ